MKKIVITGAQGQLSDCINDIIKQYKDIVTEFLSIDDLDITDSKAVLNYFNSNKYDFFVNCAAYTNVDKAESEMELAKFINAVGVRNLALSCKSQNATFIQISTEPKAVPTSSTCDFHRSQMSVTSVIYQHSVQQ